ncbi:MAG: hypothetical protein ACE5JR_04125 [Gemmatimonadota bacterium]
MSSGAAGRGRTRGAGGSQGELADARRSAARLRRRAMAAVSAAGIGGLASVYLVAAVLPAAMWRAPGSPAPVVAFLLQLGVLGATGLAIGTLRRRLTLAGLAGEVESAVGLREGELRSALELSRPGSAGSVELAALHRARVEDALKRRSPGALLPRSGAVWRRRLRMALVGCSGALGTLGVAAAARPGLMVSAAGALARPWLVSFPAAPPPLAIQPKGVEVRRGSPLRVRIRAPDRRRVHLAWRVEGELTARRLLPVDPAADTAGGFTDPIEAPTWYWAEDDRGAASDTFLARPLDPLLLTRLSIDVDYPNYLGRPPEEHTRPIPTLAVPSGTVLRIRGAVNRRLTGASMASVRMGRAVPLETDGNAFSGELRPVEDDVWGWDLRVAGGEGGVRPADSLRVAVLPDSLPSVTIVFPGVDTVLGTSMVLPLVLDARDDIGVRSVEIVSRRASALGTRGRAVVHRVAGSVGVESRLILRPVLDLGERGLLPGDTVVYFARVSDANPGHAAVASDTFRARIPNLSELRERAIERTDALAGDARRLGESARRVERAAREAERRARSRAEADSRPEPVMAGAAERAERASFAATEEGRRVLADADSLKARIGRLREELSGVAEDLERSSLTDPALHEQLHRLEELYRELLESGLSEKIRELRRALRDLDAPSLRQALERLSSEMRDLRKRIDQSVALLERAAVEQRLKALQGQAEQLAQEQRLVAEAPTGDDSWVRAEERLAGGAEELQHELERLEERLAGAAAGAAADSVGAAAFRATRAAEAMRRAAEAMGTAPRATSDSVRDRPSTDGRASRLAGASAGSAAGEMEGAARSLEAALTELTRDWRADALAAVERAATEALGLAREQMELVRERSASAAPASPSLRGRQSAVRQGLDNLLQSLAEAERKTALLDRRIGPAAAAAVRQMDRIVESLEPGRGRSPATAAEGRVLVESLNELAGRLLASRRAVEKASSATGMEEALEQLARMAEAQGSLNRDAGGLMLLHQAGQRIAGQLQRLAAEQAAIAQRLRELGERHREAELLGRPAELADEAEAIARRLAEGGLDVETLRRQERLFHRLLDAGRSLEKEDEDPERRESETAGRVTRGTLPEIDPDLLAGPRFPHPDAAAMQSIPASYRALVLDYFDRLNRDATRTERGGGAR